MSPAMVMILRAQPSSLGLVGTPARGRQGEGDATLRGSPADVRSGGPSEARPHRTVAPGRSGSENAHHVGDGGTGAGPPLVTAARRACTERNASPWRTGHDPH